MKNKGLSTIVTTLIIILLTLVAIGIIWAVVSNLLNKSSSTVEATTKCIDVLITTDHVTDNGGGNYTVTLKRNSGGEGEMCAKVVLYNNVSNTPVMDFGVKCLKPLETVTQTFDSTATGDLLNAKRIEVTPYYLDSNNKEKLCTTTTNKDF